MKEAWMKSGSAVWGNDEVTGIIQLFGINVLSIINDHL